MAENQEIKWSKINKLDNLKYIATTVTVLISLATIGFSFEKAFTGSELFLWCNAAVPLYVIGLITAVRMFDKKINKLLFESE